MFLAGFYVVNAGVFEHLRPLLIQLSNLASRLKTHTAITIKLHGPDDVWIDLQKKAFLAFQNLDDGSLADIGNSTCISDSTAVNGHFDNVFLDIPVTSPVMIFKHE